MAGASLAMAATASKTAIHFMQATMLITTCYYRIPISQVHALFKSFADPGRGKSVAKRRKQREQKQGD
jgi:hypothetical protein